MLHFNQMHSLRPFLPCVFSPFFRLFAPTHCCAATAQWITHSKSKIRALASRTSNWTPSSIRLCKLTPHLHGCLAALALVFVLLFWLAALICRGHLYLPFLLLSLSAVAALVLVVVVVVVVVQDWFQLLAVKHKVAIATFRFFFIVQHKTNEF